MIVLRPGISKVRIDELAFAPDGASIAAPAGQQGVMLWKGFANAEKSEVVKPPIVCKRLAFTPDGATLITGNDSLCALDLVSQKAARLPIKPWHSLWFGVSPDGKRLVVSEEDEARENCRVTGWAVGEYRKPVWEVVAPGLVWSLPLFPPKCDEFILIEHRRVERDWIAHRVRRSASTGKELDVSVGLADIPELVALSPDGNKLACRTREAIRLYPAGGKWKEVPTLTNDSKKHFTGVAFHPSGKFIAATSNDTTVKLYDTSTWKLVNTYTWGIGKLRSVAFSPDGTLAAAGSDSGKVVVWDVDL